MNEMNVTGALLKAILELIEKCDTQDELRESVKHIMRESKENAGACVMKHTCPRRVNCLNRATGSNTLCHHATGCRHLDNGFCSVQLSGYYDG